MKRTIAVDQQVYDAVIGFQARSGGRSANDVIRLLLGLPPKQRCKRPHATSAVTAALRDQPGSTATELAEEASLAYSTTASILAELEKAGLARREPVQARRRGAVLHRWHLIPSPPVPPADTAKLGELVSSLAEQATDEAAEARDELAEQLDEDLEEDQYDFADAMTTVAYHQPYSRWWATVIHRIEHDGLDPATALHETREAAHLALLGLGASTPCAPTQDLLLILHRATSDFRRDTDPATLHTLHGTSPGTQSR